MRRALIAATAPAPRAALGGILVGLAGPPLPAALLPAGFVGAILLSSALLGARPGAAAGRGWAFGFAANLVAMGFVPQTILRFTDLPLIGAIAALILLAAAQGAAYAAAGWLAALVTRPIRGRTVEWPIAFGVGVAVATLGPALFPWTLAAPLGRAPVLLQAAEIVGERGIAIVLAIAAGFVASGIRARRVAPVAVAVALLVLLAGYGALRIPSVDRARARAVRPAVVLVQQAVDPKERWRPERAPAIAVRLWELTRRAQDQGADLVIWPEAAWPFVLGRHEAVERGPYRIRGPGIEVDVLAGVLTEAAPPDGEPDGAGRWHLNAAVIVDREGRISPPAAKIDLLAFGEYVPLGDRIPWLRRTFARGGGLRPGRAPVLLSSGPIRAGTLNCYEDTLPGAVRRLSAIGANLLVNVTNDAWFDGTAEPELHLLAAIPRAIEGRRDLVRATNTGVTAHVDAAGRVVARAPRDVATLLRVEPALLDGPPTPYQRFGDATWLIPLLLLALAARRRAPASR